MKPGIERWPRSRVLFCASGHPHLIYPPNEGVQWPAGSTSGHGLVSTTIVTVKKSEQVGPEMWPSVLTRVHSGRRWGATDQSGRRGGANDLGVGWCQVCWQHVPCPA